MLSVVVLALLAFSGASGEDLSPSEQLEYFRQIIQVGDHQLANNHLDVAEIGDVSLPLGVLKDFKLGNFSTLRLVGPDEFQYVNRTEADGVVVFYFTFRLGLDIKADATFSFGGYNTPMGLQGDQNEIELTGALTINTNKNGYKCSASLQKGSIIKTGTYWVVADDQGWYGVPYIVSFVVEHVLNFLLPSFNSFGLLRGMTDYLVRAVSSSSAFNFYACSSFST